MLIPVGLVSVDGLARASRANEPVGTTLLWTLARSLPFLAMLAFALLMSLVDLIPSPAFPFDPQLHSFGIGAALALVAMVAVFVLALIGSRSLAPPRAADEALTPAIGLAIFVSIATVWLADPYLALLLVPTAHLWLGAALPEVRGRVVPVVIALLLGLVVPVIAVGFLGSALGVGWGVPWQLVLMFTGGHFGVPESFGLCRPRGVHPGDPRADLRPARAGEGPSRRAAPGQTRGARVARRPALDRGAWTQVVVPRTYDPWGVCRYWYRLGIGTESQIERNGIRTTE